ncbi:Phosphoglycerate transporter protein [Escherichia coli]|nr:Phosphoglycerate transporter protein [Escherichia coli]CAH4962368.1 Phosphoglycerate transporter protein [Escherichia coli]
MLSIFKTGQAADSVPAEKIQVTYRRYRMQALLSVWICPYISRHLLSLNPLLACCRRYSRGER